MLVKSRLITALAAGAAMALAPSVGLAQSTVFGVVLGAGSVLSALPIWAIVPSLALPTATWVAGRFALRRRPGERQRAAGRLPAVQDSCCNDIGTRSSRESWSRRSRDSPRRFSKRYMVRIEQ